MNKQKLAQKRNYFKFVLSGLYKPIDLDCLSEFEKEQWNEILNIRDNMLAHFDLTSKQNGLNVPDKCWCGKPAKYLPEQGEYPLTITKVCKKHIKNE